MTASADRIHQMRAAHDSVEKIDAVVTAFRDSGDLYRALSALADTWPLTRKAPDDAPRTPRERPRRLP